MRIVPNKELSSYKVLPFDLYTEDRNKIFEAGEVLTPGKLIMLKNYVRIYTEEFSETDSRDKNKIASEVIPSQVLNFSYESIDPSDFETVINKDAYVRTDIQVRIKYFYRRILDLFIQGYYEEGILKINSLVSILKSEVLKKVNKSGKGSRVRFLGEYEICHPLNVAVIAGLIAKKLEYSPRTIDKIVLAGLLHDIGKLKVDLEGSEAMITMNEDEVREHTILGYKLIRNEFKLPDEIALVALEHHENNDGSGYPQGISNDSISEFTQIINVANYYDNLAFNRTNELVTNNKEALRVMLEVGSKKFAASILYTFIHMFNYDDSKSFNDMAV